MASLDDLVLEEMFFVPMNCLLGAVIPTRIDPPLPATILPSSVYLRNDGFGEIVRVADMHPITYQMVNHEILAQ